MLMCIMIAYLALFAALFNVLLLPEKCSFKCLKINAQHIVCLHSAFLPLIFEYAFLHDFSKFIDTRFVYLRYYFASCTVLLICWFS